MKLRVRFPSNDGLCRTELSGRIKEVLINEDLLHPEEESISLCFRGQTASGIVDLSPAEIEMLYDAIRGKIHLIKGLRRLSGSGARLL